MARKQNKPSRYIRMREAGNRTATGRDEKRHEPPRGKDRCPRILLPSPRRGNSEAKKWQRESLHIGIQSPALSMSESCCCGLLFSGFATLLRHSGGYQIRGSTPTGVCCRRLWNQLFQVFACVHDMPPNGLGPGGLRGFASGTYFEQPPCALLPALYRSARHYQVQSGVPVTLACFRGFKE